MTTAYINYQIRIGYYKIRDSSLHRLPDYIFMGLTIVHLMIYNSSKVSSPSLSSLTSLSFRSPDLDAQLSATLKTQTLSSIQQRVGGGPHGGPAAPQGAGPPQPRPEQHHRPPRRGIHRAEQGDQAITVR